AIAQGVTHITGRVAAVGVQGGVKSVTIETQAGTQIIATQKFVVAAGPLQKSVCRMLDVEIPVVCEPHLKVMFNDPQHVIPRNMGLFIWNDPVTLPWSEAEKDALAESD